MSYCIANCLEIIISPLVVIIADGLLLQCSTLSDSKEFSFAATNATSDNSSAAHSVPGAYIEFAERLYADDRHSESGLESDRRDGFETTRYTFIIAVVAINFMYKSKYTIIHIIDIISVAFGYYHHCYY